MCRDTCGAQQAKYDERYEVLRPFVHCHECNLLVKSRQATHALSSLYIIYLDIDSVYTIASATRVHGSLQPSGSPEPAAAVAYSDSVGLYDYYY